MDKLSLIAIVAILIFAAYLGYFFGSSGLARMNPNSVSRQELDLRQNMRGVWMDHMVDTRSVMLNVIDGKNTDQSMNLLLQNQFDMGNLIAKYYGNDAGVQMTHLLVSGHIDIIFNLLVATKAGNTTLATESNTTLYDNGVQIAAFLANLNPNWKEQDFISMWNNHLNLTEQEAAAGFANDTNRELSLFEQTRNQSVSMADWFSDGIVKQFPQNFTQ